MGILRSLVDTPHKKPVARSFDIVCAISALEQTFEQIIEAPTIWDAIALIMMSL